MLGLPTEFMQMDLKLVQNDDVTTCLTVKNNVCDRCQHFYEQNGYLSPDLPCAECLKISESSETNKTICSICSLENCVCHTVYQCAYCSEGFLSTALLQKHTFIHCSEVETNVLNVPDSSRDVTEIEPGETLVVPRETKCHSCNDEFELFDPLKHVCSAKYICHVCGAGLSTAYNLRVHLMKHAGALPYKCDLCLKSFCKPSELSRHLGVHTGVKQKPRPGVKSYPCDVCSKTFSRPADLRRHVLTHSGTRPFACTVCGLAFSDTSNLKKHITTHTKNGDLKKVVSKFVDVKTYHCSYCNKMFSKPSELKRHFITHKTTTFSCDFCGLAYGDADSLKKHVENHAKMGLRDCISCQVSFDSFEALEIHVAKHPNRLQDESECAKCDICGKAFSSQFYLSDHRARHTESRPFSCHECPKTFKSGSHLKNHMLTHSGARCQICAVCGKSFLTKSSLRRHETIHSRPERFIHHLMTPGDSEAVAQPELNHKSSETSSWEDFCELKPPHSTHSQDLLTELAPSAPPLNLG